MNHVAVFLGTYGDEFRYVEFYAAKYAEVDPDFGYYYQMTEPEYVNQAVPCFDIRIMERFFGWMGLVEKKEVLLHTLYKVSPLFRKLIGVNRPEARVVISIKNNGSSEVN